MNYFTTKVRPSHEGDTAGPSMLAKANGFFSTAAISIANFFETVVVGSWDFASTVVSSTVVKSISNVTAMVTFELLVYLILAISCILIACVLNFDQIFKNSQKDKDNKTEQPRQQYPENAEVPPSELAPTAEASYPQPQEDDPICEFRPSGF